MEQGRIELEATRISVAFGGVRAVVDLSLSVRSGELVGLIGPNGAGKTTAIDAISGFVPHQGSVTVSGTDVSGEPPHDRARAGLSRTWQSLELFDDLTVRENCQVASEPQTFRQLVRSALWPSSEEQAPTVDVALAALDLSDRAEQSPDALSLGERKLVGVARALAADPTVLLLDEPAAGLDTDESLAFGSRLRSLVDDRQLATVLVDHDMSLVLSICDRVVVLDTGAVIAEGTPGEIRGNEQVIAAYLGGD